MERDAAVITLKRTGISIPQRKRHAHRLAAVIMLKRTGIFVPQRKLSCKQAFSSCERGYTYRLGVNYSTFVPLLVSKSIYVQLQQLVAYRRKYVAPGSILYD